MNAVDALLRVEDCDAGYGSLAVLRGISFSLARGSITAMLGANGAGKTTTLRALCGMVRRRGRMTFDGRRIDGLATEDVARLGIAHVPEGRGTVATLTVEENLRLGAITRRDRDGVKDDFERLYALFPRLRERRAQQAGLLSGGEQQMLAIARALMLRPRLLLLDEPSFGLAPRVVADIFATLARINREDGTAMLLVEQNAALALDLADHAYLVETGRIVLGGTAAEIRDHADVRRAYLGH